MTDKDDLFESLVDRGVPLPLAARAEQAALKPNPEAQIIKLVSHVFWLGVIALTELVIIIALIVALVR